MIEGLMLRITVFDADGNIVTDHESPAQTASQAQIDEMVKMIEGGTPAHLAASLAMQDQGAT